LGKVLLVDDDPEILKIASRVLEFADHEVHTVNSALGAFKILKKEDFDVVVSDANMPGYSGFELVKVLRADAKTKDLGIALLTARREKEDIENALKSGVDDYILKPLDPHLLVGKVEALLKKRANQDDNEISLSSSESFSEATLETPLNVISISEIGFTIEAPFELREGDFPKLQVPLFKELKWVSARYKVLGCSKSATTSKYRIRLGFVGVDDTQLQRLRAWMNNYLLNKRKKVAS